MHRHLFASSGLFLAAAGVFLASSPSVAPSGAAACSCDGSTGWRTLHTSPRVVYGDTPGVLPMNGVFIGGPFRFDEDWRDEGGAPLVLTRDEALSDVLGVEVRRSAAPLVLGETYAVDGGCSGCGASFVVGPADELPPDRANLAAPNVAYADWTSGGNGCQSDLLTLTIEGSDDVTPDDELGILAWVADSEEGLASAELAALFGFDGDAPGRATLRLGTSVEHRRTGTGLSVEGPFCFAVAFVDHAGHVGPRSEARCLDTTDRDDPAVEVVPYAPACSGAFCAVQSGAPRGSARSLLATVAVALVLFARHRAR